MWDHWGRCENAVKEACSRRGSCVRAALLLRCGGVGATWNAECVGEPRELGTGQTGRVCVVGGRADGIECICVRAALLRCLGGGGAVWAAWGCVRAELRRCGVALKWFGSGARAAPEVMVEGCT